MDAYNLSHMDSQCQIYSTNELDLIVPSFIPVKLSPFDDIVITKEIDPLITIVERFSEVPFGPQE